MGANLNPSQPCQSSHLKKRLLCFTSELPNRQSWPPAYAQQQQSWLIAHRSTVHTSSCNAMESLQPCPKDGLCHPGAVGHPRLLGTFTAGTNPSHSRAEAAVSALPGENHTANITRLVFLTAAERRLQHPAHSLKCNRMGWGKKSIFTLLQEPCLASSVQASTASRAGACVFLLLITVKMSCQAAQQTGWKDPTLCSRIKNTWI